MAHTHQYLTYYIHLTDLAVVTALQATGSPETIGAVLTNPDAIATERTAPIKLKTQPFVAPCLTSEWFGSAAQFPTNVDTFDRKSGGWFGIPWLFGDTTTYHWRGLWTYAPPAVVPGVSVPINIAKLRWMDGFEILDPAAGNIGPENGLNGDANNDNKYNSHAASRHADGSGFAWRNNTLVRTHNITENGHLLANAYASWERFYLRLWQAPAAQTRLWTSRTTNALDGYALEITPSGQIAYGWQNSAGTFVLVGTAATALPIGVWKKIDVRFWFGSPTLGANQFELWINGVIAASGLINAAGALGGPAGTPPPTWSALTTYIVGQTAYSGGRAYQCIVQHTNQAPPNVTYWTDVSQVAIDGTSLGYFKPHASSRFGNAVANTMAIDIDDWICGDHMGAPDGVDFQNGTRVIQVRATGFDAASANYTGDWRWANLAAPTDGPASVLTSAVNGAVLALTTDGAAVDALPESLGAIAIRVQLWQTGGANPGTNEAICTGAGLSTGAVAQSVTAADWKTAFKTLSGTPTAVKPIAPIVLKHIKGNALVETIRRCSATVALIGSFGREDLGPLAPSPNILPKPTGPHNNPYPRTPWARSTVAPIMPVFVRAGTYVGNGTAQDLTFPMPIHFFRARPATVAVAGGTLWWSTMMASHLGCANALDGTGVVQALMDDAFVPAVTETTLQMEQRRIWEAKMQTRGTPPTATDYTYWVGLFDADPGAVVAGVLIDYWWQKLLGKDATGVDIPPNGPYAVPPSALLPLAAGISAIGGANPQQSCLLRIVGSDPQSNANGVTYSYLAIGDPGQRYLLNGALINETGQAADVATPLILPTFTPEAIFLQGDEANSATAGAFFVGKGNLTALTGMATQGETAAAIAVAAGTITTKQPCHLLAAANFAGGTPPFSAWRTDDGSSDAVGSNKGKVVQITSYVGDGSASRSIALLPAVGKRPLWALVVPHNAGATYYRDPAHTTANASRWDTGGLLNTAIIGGGLDTLTVGITLNTAAVVYEVLAIPGDSVAGNDGFSVAGDFWPVPPDPPPAWIPVDAPSVGPAPGAPPAAVVVPVGVGGDPLAATGAMPGLTDDLAATCTADTHRLVNVALARLGVAVQIANLLTDTTAEATAARLVYPDAVAATLRDFPWPFATRYAQLAVVATTPNSDWAFAYRQPTDCLFERRLVVSRGPALDPTPPAFQLSSDLIGGLIFTNQPNAVLEYTARPKCPVTRSEPLFREALGWRMAVALAPALTRMTDLAVAAQKMYEEALVLARQVLRPGNPGVRPVVGTVDVSAAAQQANLVVVNRALLRIGATTIASLFTDQSEGSQAAQLIFEDELRATLRDHPWAFATAYADPLVLVAGAPGTPVNKDWTYAYRVPADLVFARRLVSPSGRSYEGSIAQGGFMSGIPLPAYPLGQPQPLTFRLGRDTTGSLLFTNQATPALEYTARPEGAVLVADALFRDAFAWRLAAMLAPSLSQMVPETPDQVGRGPDPDPQAPKQARGTGVQLRQQAAAAAWKMYRLQLVKAAVADANEQQQEPDGNADWINAR